MAGIFPRHGFFLQAFPLTNVATSDHGEHRSAIAIIPARYGSTRVPGKPLADIGGKTMVERVYERARMAQSLERVIVATDDDRICAVIPEADDVVMTDPAHESGSDRVAEVASGLACEIVVNIQGDLPLLEAELVDRLVRTLRVDPELDIATCAVPVSSLEEFRDPGAVKVVVDGNGRALYFSRAPIPHVRDATDDYTLALHHIGLYAYRRESLLRFASLEPTRLERAEKLEQLRALEHGMKIGVVVHDGPPPMEVDTDEDLRRARRAVEAESDR